MNCSEDGWRIQVGRQIAMVGERQDKGVTDD